MLKDLELMLLRRIARALAAGMALLCCLPGAPAHAAERLGPESAQSPRPGKSSPGSSEVDGLIAGAETARGQGELTQAERLLGAALQLQPTSIAANLGLGNLFLSQHRNDEAMQRFEVVLAILPADAQARSGEKQAAIDLALRARRANNGEKALACLLHARTILPDDVTILSDLGMQARQMHQLRLAEDALRAALAISAEDPTALYALAGVESDLDHFPDSEKLFHAYLAQRPGDSTAHFGLGQLLERELRDPEAAKEFNRSIELQPMQTESYYHLGQIALSANRAEDAAKFYEKTLSRMPTHGGALTGMGILHYRGKEYPQAKTLLEAAIKAAPDFQTAHYYLGLTLARMGEKAASERELKEAEELRVAQQGKQKPVASIDP